MEMENYLGRHGGDMSKSPGVAILKSLKGLVTTSRVDKSKMSQITPFVKEFAFEQVNQLI